MCGGTRRKSKRLARKETPPFLQIWLIRQNILIWKCCPSAVASLKWKLNSFTVNTGITLRIGILPKGLSSSPPLPPTEEWHFELHALANHWTCCLAKQQQWGVGISSVWVCLKIASLFFCPYVTEGLNSLTCFILIKWYRMYYRWQKDNENTEYNHRMCVCQGKLQLLKFLLVVWVNEV